MIKKICGNDMPLKELHELRGQYGTHIRSEVQGPLPELTILGYLRGSVADVEISYRAGGVSTVTNTGLEGLFMASVQKSLPPGLVGASRNSCQSSANSTDDLYRLTIFILSRSTSQ